LRDFCSPSFPREEAKLLVLKARRADLQVPKIFGTFLSSFARDRCPVHVRPGDLTDILEISTMGAGLTKSDPLPHYLAMIPYHLPTSSAGNLSAGRARQVKLTEGNLYLVNPK